MEALTDKDYECPEPDCGRRMELKGCEHTRGDGWICTLMCHIHKKEVKIFKKD